MKIGALTVLDNLRAARDAARQKRADIESAAEGRRIATLALEARNRVKPTTAQVITRYEEVTRLDPRCTGTGLNWVASVPTRVTCLLRCVPPGLQLTRRRMTGTAPLR